MLQKQIKQKASHECADDSERDVEPKALALSVDDLASNKTGNQT
jgi:hypothetical protein